MSTILISIATMAGLGVFFAFILAIANQKLGIKEDPRIEKIMRVLPGVNCAACGYATCHQYAEALAGGSAESDRCKAGGERVRCELSEMFGVETGEKIKELAIVHCGADKNARKKKGIYTGIKTCAAGHAAQGGELLCAYGCFGYGDCFRACPFGAIEMVNGLPKISKDRCTACGKCVVACPRGIISLEKIVADYYIYTACNNKDKGLKTRAVCPVGCIACGICQRMTGGIFTVENDLANVKSEKTREIQNPDDVISKCPTKCILKVA